MVGSNHNRTKLLKDKVNVDNDTKKGLTRVILLVEDSAVIDETNVVSFSSGSLGGKGHGLSFINRFIYSFELSRLTPGINIKTPVTAIIGTDEFDMLMERNHLWDKVKEEKDFEKLQILFLNECLSYTLEKELKIFIRLINIAVGLGQFVVEGAGYFIDSETIYTDDLLLVTKKSMGNGVIRDINDLIYLEPGEFNNMLTNQMASEIDIGYFSINEETNDGTILWDKLKDQKVLKKVDFSDTSGLKIPSLSGWIEGKEWL